MQKTTLAQLIIAVLLLGFPVALVGATYPTVSDIAHQTEDPHSCEVEKVSDASTTKATDGSAIVHMTGGIAPYTYLWSNGETTQTATQLGVGTHQVTVTDSDGCSSVCEVTISCSTTPPEEVCDGVDNDGDGQIDEGFDADGDGIPDCEDDCDDRIDTDGDGTPDCTDDCDDTIDSDGDGIPDCEDDCDDRIDSDGDGISDCIDDCDDSIDTDGDGTPDCVDDCDDSIDTDGDGISDCEDDCDDRIDTDGDGTPDCTDDCDDTIDTDGDGTPDCVDDCDDTIDSDGDGTPDCVDDCDDTIDSDGDGISDCEDDCDDTIDTDGDGTPDCTDDCDDRIDTDGDGTPDCTDDCDDTIDSDGDGVPDCVDVCPGSDDTADSDNDGIPDGCDVEECDGLDNDGDGQIDEDLDCEEPTGECQTAFARYTPNNTSFCEDNLGANRWGWTNFFDTEGNYNMEFYSGAGQCDTSNGYQSGNVTVAYSNDIVTVTINLLPGNVMTQAHLYVGEEKYPEDNKGDPTVAPGQYTQVVDPLNNVTSYQFQPIDVSDYTNGFYVIVHAETCPTGEVEKQGRSETLVEMKPFPTVFNTDFEVGIESAVPTRAILQVYTLNGVSIKRMPVELQAGMTTIPVNLPGLNSAMYLLEVRTPQGQSLTAKIMAR
ncbi:MULTISPECIES: SprB repeat-containing protein [unclassified Robiginitalea]|uniref:SprB repeat-containing protein n=1 Tax=Robiginitalea TaxID=252306 RepID=UPI00234BB963|nr:MULTISPECIES: SprB repeat-containing protein [unclassified Robiginitalea]MDC6355438.1 SprB repeat-containing protein [Robiginitalea sp. PM2]MDC6375952.1 SprB repeat-containing protein [Robiginitalea sp. SP8]